MKIAHYVGIAALACGLEIVGCTLHLGAQSKPPRRVLEAMEATQKAAYEAAAKWEEGLWRPVAAALASGDVSRTRQAASAYAAAGGQFGYRQRVGLGRFYLQKGDLRDAKAQLDPVVGLSDPLIDPVSAKAALIMHMHTVVRRPRQVRQMDAETLCLWEKAAANAPEAEKEAVLDRWYANYNLYGLKPGALESYNVSPVGLTELEAGQWCMGSKSTYGEAVEHYRKAVALCPTSVHAIRQLAMGLRFNGQSREAQLVDARARMLSGNPRER